MPETTLDTLKERISCFPRKTLAQLPTPLARLDGLTRELGGPEIWIKRDDLTGAGFGGNKSRKLEFIIADALAKKARALVTWGGVQSNWCMQTASAARRFGLQPVLVLFKTTDAAAEYDGNLLLDFILGADVRVRQAERAKLVAAEVAEREVREVAAALEARGETPYVVAVGGSMPGLSMTRPLGALGYVAALVELEEQAAAAGLEYTHIIHATGSGATQAGLVVGAGALGRGAEIIGISVSDPKDVFSNTVFRIARETERALRLGRRLRVNDIVVFDDYIKEGYGVLNAQVAEAIRLVFAAEGIVLDPVYTGKAMAGLVDLVGRGRLGKGDKVVFFHTGGTPALFPYRAALVNFLKSGPGRRSDADGEHGESA
jgi:L-cysteate sulfo-lyase